MISNQTTGAPTTSIPTLSPSTGIADASNESYIEVDKGLINLYTILIAVVLVSCIFRKRIWTCWRTERSKCFPHTYHSVSEEDDILELTHYKEAETDLESNDGSKGEHED